MCAIIQGSAATKDTLSDRRIMNVVKAYTTNYSRIVDPFARNCELAAPFTNDINPNTKAKFCMDALNFLEMLEEDNCIFDVALMDPPFSQRQEKELYGTNLYTQPRRIKQIELAIGNIVRPGGYVIKFGYNSNFSHKAFELVHVVLVQYQASINDTIISIHEKTNHDIRSYDDEQ